MFYIAASQVKSSGLIDFPFSNNNNNNNNNNENMNMNGRRIFKMIKDFAFNVAENFGIYDDDDLSNEIEKKPRITEIGSQVPIFGRPETVFDPNSRNSYLTTTTTTTTPPTVVTTTASPTLTSTGGHSLFSDNYSNIREVFKAKDLIS